MVYTIELVANKRVILVTMAANYGNFTNKKSLNEWIDCITEIESVQNQHLYANKPVIFTSKLSSNIFCGGADLKSSPNEYSKPNEGIEHINYVMRRICTMQRRTVAKIHGHAIGGGFFIGLACDVRFGLNDDKIILSIPEVDVGFPYASFSYLLVQSKMPNFAWKLFVNNVNYKYTPQEALKEGYFQQICNTKDELLKVCVDSALQVHPDTFECYLSVKNYFLQRILKQWNGLNVQIFLLQSNGELILQLL
eukprot:301520_1